MGEGEDGVVLSLEGRFDFGEVGSRSDGSTDLIDSDSVRSEAVGEASCREEGSARYEGTEKRCNSRITKVSAVEDEGLLSDLDEIGGDEIPVRCCDERWRLFA